MYIIIGLGNPEAEYAKTRHNMGFDVINQIAKEYHITMNQNKFDSLYGEGRVENQKVILVKPQTFMNLSGKAVRQWVDFYKISEEECIVIYDDMDLEKGTMKIRKKGGPGSHNGMKSVQEHLGTSNFPRIRVGIGSPENKQDVIHYVLGKLSKEEYDVLEQGIQKASMAVADLLKYGIDHAMNQYN